MKPFTFALMLLAQRADEAVRRARPGGAADPYLVTLLRLRRRRLKSRLRRSLAPLAALEA